jgi:hypothetical protein
VWIGANDAAPPPSAFSALTSALSPLASIPLLCLVLPVVWRFFRGTWKELDEDAQKWRGEILASGKMDLRPFVALVLCAVILTMQEHCGNRAYFNEHLRPLFVKYELTHPHALGIFKYEELWGFAWWAGTRIGGYMLPFAVWKLFFREDSLLDFGLRTKGFFTHIWIYGLFLGVVLPAMWVVSHESSFLLYYPFYKQSKRSWFDFLT